MGDQPGVCLLSVNEELGDRGFEEVDLSPSCQSRRMEKGGIVPPPFGLGPWTALGSCRHGALSSAQAKESS